MLIWKTPWFKHVSSNSPVPDIYFKLCAKLSAAVYNNPGEMIVFPMVFLWFSNGSHHFPMVNEDILVGGFKHDFCFPFHIWDAIRNPLTTIFQRGWYTTNQ